MFIKREHDEMRKRRFKDGGKTSPWKIQGPRGEKK